MFQIFLFVRYLRRTFYNLKRITLSDPTQMMSMGNRVTIGVTTPHIDDGCSFEKEFTELILMNP